MKIIQITDMHIDAPGDNTYGVNVRKNFTDVLDEVKRRKPDLLVLTGDFCHTSSHGTTYRWVKAKVELTKIPYRVISGNHDNSTDLAEAFGLEKILTGKELYYKDTVAGCEFLFLDSGAYFVSTTQLEWLKENLDKALKPVNIFIHHPPCIGGVKFMDEKHPLQNWQEVQSVLLGCKQPVRVFCGHYHTERSIQIDKLSVYITPSTYVQIASESLEFQADHFNVAFREIILKDDTLRTEVRYLPGNGEMTK